MLKYLTSEEESFGSAKFLVLSVGGSGGNMVQHFVNQKSADVAVVAIDTDAQALNALTVPTKYQLGKKNLGSRPPQIQQMLAKTHQDDLRALLVGYDMVFIATGVGGGTGTGVAPVIAQIAKEMGILTVAVVALPFGSEGNERKKIAKQGLSELSACVNMFIAVSNDRILAQNQQLSTEQVFQKANEVLWQVVQGIIEVVDDSSMLGIDFKDVSSAIRSSGRAMVGMGRAMGKNRASLATKQALESPFINGSALKTAKRLLVSIKGAREKMLLGEGYEVSELLATMMGLEDDRILWGFVYDEMMGEDIQVTIVATGLEMSK